jgi:hypothetical protein
LRGFAASCWFTLPWRSNTTLALLSFSPQGLHFLPHFTANKPLAESQEQIKSGCSTDSCAQLTGSLERDSLRLANAQLLSLRTRPFIFSHVPFNDAAKQTIETIAGAD